MAGAEFDTSVAFMILDGGRESEQPDPSWGEVPDPPTSKSEAAARDLQKRLFLFHMLVAPESRL